MTFWLDFGGDFDSNNVKRIYIPTNISEFDINDKMENIWRKLMPTLDLNIFICNKHPGEAALNVA